MRTRKSDELAIWLYAIGAYALALIGAFGVAWLLGLSGNELLLVVGAVGLIAIFGTLVPVLRLGYSRLASRRGRSKN